MVNYKVRRSEEKEISKNITSLTNIEEKRNNAAFSIAVLIAFCFHAQIEAWWVGVGSIQLPLFFMVIGQAAHFSNWKFTDENDG